MADEIAPHLRPITFAANELTLDLVYLLQSYAKTDLESVVILLCVTDATMRPFMQSAEQGDDALTVARPSNDIRGAISRRMIAEKTGISRESVRRKTQDLADAGLLVIDNEHTRAVLLQFAVQRDGVFAEKPQQVVTTDAPVAAGRLEDGDAASLRPFSDRVRGDVAKTCDFRRAKGLLGFHERI